MSAERRAILIIDDEKNLVSSLKDALEFSEEYDVHVAFDGKQALYIVKLHQPDLILLDIMMPHLDGIEFLERLRKMREGVKTPVVIISARTDDETKARALSLDCRAYLAKPFSVAELKSTIDKILSEPSEG